MIENLTFSESDIIHHIPEAEMQEFIEKDLPAFEAAYANIKKTLST